MRSDLVLVVDLDGTLLRSDILLESFWLALGQNWRTIFSIFKLKNGRAALKRHLANTVSLDIAALPYDPTVINYIKRWRERGGRTVLATASDQLIADKIAKHLNLFDEVHGSNGIQNLKGSVKANFLAQRFADTEFIYMGDSAADMPIWKSANKGITVNAPRTLRSHADSLGIEMEHLNTTSNTVYSYCKALRPHQWLKNLLVFLPMLLSHQLSTTLLFQSLLAFISFCLISSSAYVLNDLADLKSDRAHPRKRMRPFAAGIIPLAHGGWMVATLLFSGTILAAVQGWNTLAVVLIYYVLTIVYSCHLKQKIIIDICVLAGLYTMRLIYGGTATGISLSPWLLVFSIFFFFGLASIKRQAELVDNSKRGISNVSGRGYHIRDLPFVSMIGISSSYISVLVMGLYINSPDTLELYAFPPALWGICVVLLYWTSYLSIVTHRGEMHDDPVLYAAKNRTSHICFLLILVLMIGATTL